MIVHDSDKEVKENKERLQLNGGANVCFSLFCCSLLKIATNAPMLIF